jgi:hypothetical protein
VNLAEFNTSAGKLFNVLITYLRRRYGDVQYARSAEVQERLALHFHVPMRVEFVNLMLRDFNKTDPDCSLRMLVESVGFGHELTLDRVESGHAWYCAKYVSKTCDDRYDLPWLDRETSEIVKGNSRYRPWSASRHWGTTMASIRAAQRAWIQESAPAGALLDHRTQRYTDGASSPPEPVGNSELRLV